jgi:hypothetical protein
MNSVHLHLLSNHIPIFTSLFGALLGLWGYFSKNKGVSLFAMATLIAGGLAAMVASNTGGEAEELVENMAGFSHALIHTHEEAAEAATLFAIAIGGLASISLYLLAFQKAKASLVSLATSIIAIALFAAMVNTASSGGQIAHPELKTLDK